MPWPSRYPWRWMIVETTGSRLFAVLIEVSRRTSRTTQSSFLRHSGG
jgi:hypothetical protein